MYLFHPALVCSSGTIALTVKWTRTVMYLGHCACPRQLNMNAASRLKTSHIQVMVTSGYLFFPACFPPCLPLFGRENPFSCRRLCFLNAPLFHKFKLKSYHEQTSRQPSANQMYWWLLTYILAGAATFANIFRYLCSRSIFAWHLACLAFYLVTQLVVCVALRSR